jgi:tetratricopeptide (TPR) repeat protein
MRFPLVFLLLLALTLPALLHAQESKSDEAPDAGRTEKRLRLADELEAQGDDEGALRILEQLVKKDPENVALLQRVIALQLRADRVPDAVVTLRKLLEIEGGSPEQYASLARALIESEQSEAAVPFLEDAAKRFPEMPDFPFLLTFALARLERWSDAVAQFEKTLTLAKDDPNLINESFHFRHGAALEQSGNHEKGVELLRKTLSMIRAAKPEETDPEFTATVLNYLAYLWVDRNENLEEAGTMAKEAITLSPDNGAIADTLGWWYFRKGDYPRALADLKKAERLIEEPDPVILDHLGQTLMKLDEKEFAADYFRQALELEPENAEVKKRLEEAEK